MSKFILLLLVALCATKGLRRLTTNIESASKASPATARLVSGFKNIEEFKEAIQKIAMTYEEYFHTFTNSVSNTSVLFNVSGFKSFQMDSNSNALRGLRGQRYDTFFKQKAEIFNLNEENQKALTKLVEEAKGKSSKEWSQINLIYKDSKDDKAFNCLNVFINSEDKSNEKYDIFVLFMKGIFEKADDILYVQESRIENGGMWEVKEDKFISKPKSLGEKDIKELVAFYNILRIRYLTSLIGKILPLPYI